MWLRCLLPLFLCASIPPSPDGPDTALPPAMTGADLRLERFVIYTKRVEAGRTPTVDVSGFVELRRRDTPSGPQLECDTRFLVGAIGANERRFVQRVVHVEGPEGSGPRCLWREIGPHSGRSVQAEWSKDGRALEITEWSSGPKRKGTLIVSGAASMPLYLEELLRNGRMTAGNVVVFDPLALTLEPLEVKTVWLDESEHIGEDDPGIEGAAPRAVRTIELVRTDGSLAARYRFRGRDLVAFQWQEGPTYARVVDASEFETLLALHADPLVKSVQTR
jgi:hypothetical protein